ncbi:hypothetical protein [Flavicella sp.]|uniref:hypothetical protein n=1 Tax=Flavicella sp. TaxID=2957742 RepID=UPI00261F3612|nr:hypothetical protein [Flavicella sp.]MDG1805940.1 hypothetical protein [Flavicella sp.]
MLVFKNAMSQDYQGSTLKINDYIIATHKMNESPLPTSVAYYGQILGIENLKLWLNSYEDDHYYDENYIEKKIGDKDFVMGFMSGDYCTSFSIELPGIRFCIDEYCFQIGDVRENVVGKLTKGFLPSDSTTDFYIIYGDGRMSFNFDENLKLKKMFFNNSSW